ncbi:FAD-binding oxidoreductase [Sphingomonas sp. DG1-23]|uniref:FAD-binding oxidoreductase n=1 Tax=Sphingomonas sp. DG1-23 TaxID=3068316 RepID=UPI00273FDA56|nr:FAD-binding oxidoreductase [Sphingomonas sp. DG1-23]MDP5278682.1 FAD-binding oxidoreductase [Sphingomonas sp. DG1-23]
MLARGQSGFDRRVAIENGARVALPAIVVSPRCVRDVALAVSIATEHGWPVSIKGGGHGAAGFCLVEGGVTIDMHRLDRIAISPTGDSVMVEAGVRWLDAYAALAAFDEALALIGGACADVGVAGFLLGGGYSFLSRKFGLGCDHVRAMKMVLADGSAVVASQDSNPDLFWACRGGGGGNFGVVTEFELATVRPDHAELAFVECVFSDGAIAPMLERYHAWAASLSTDIAAYGRWFAAGATGSGQRVQLTCVGDCPPEEIVARLEPLLTLGGVIVDVQRSTMHRFADTLGERTKLGGKPALVRSGFVQFGAAWPRMGEVLAKSMASAPNSDAIIIWTHAGGRIASIRPDESAFVHRSADYLLEMKAPWQTGDQQIAVKKWVDALFDGLGSYISGAYVNYADPELKDWEQDYYGKNANRLRSIKKDRDPFNVFNFAQSIDGFNL